MERYLRNLPDQLQDIISVACGLASRLKVRAYLVGGFVRDLILGVPNLDVDIVLEADALRFADELCSQLKGKLTKHRRFGTATIIMPDKLKIDVATARKEIYLHPAALPTVFSGTIEDDLRRRDFTINAMAISISNDDFGRFIDFFGGRQDLKSKYIRVMHDLSFIDDPTRILRAIRFEQRYNMHIEPHTLRLLKNALKDGMLELVNKQRIRDEVILLLKEYQPIKYIRRLNSIVGFSFISPKIYLTKNSFRFLKSADKEISEFKKMFPRKRLLDTWLIYFTIILDSLGGRSVSFICKKFAFRCGETVRIISFVNNFSRIESRLNHKLISPSQIYKLLEPLSYEVIILIKAKTKKPLVNKHIEDFLRIYNGIRLHISGEDLKDLGIKPSPYFKNILTKALYAKIDHKLSSKDEELAFIKRFIEKKKRLIA